MAADTPDSQVGILPPVVAYLSDEWIDLLDSAASSDAHLAEATKGVELTIQHEVTGGPDGDVRWHVTFHEGMVRVRRGAAERPDIRFSQDHATATAIGRSELSAQTAFMVGRLRVGGDIGLLIEHQDALDSVDDVFAGVRAVTEI